MKLRKITKQRITVPRESQSWIPLLAMNFSVDIWWVGTGKKLQVGILLLHSCHIMWPLGNVSTSFTDDQVAEGRFQYPRSVWYYITTWVDPVQCPDCGTVVIFYVCSWILVMAEHNDIRCVISSPTLWGNTHHYHNTRLTLHISGNHLIQYPLIMEMAEQHPLAIIRETVQLSNFCPWLYKDNQSFLVCKKLFNEISFLILIYVTHAMDLQSHYRLHNWQNCFVSHRLSNK